MVEQQKMNERENILGRIREALSVPAQKPGGHDLASEKPCADCDSSEPHPVSDWLPFVGASLEERLELFAKNSKELTTDFRLVNSVEELQTQLVGIAKTEGWTRIATQASELTDAAANALGLPVLRTDGGYDVCELEKCDAGISVCDALVAQTGGVLVTSQSSGGRALSVLPPHHVVLARREQLVPDLTAAFALLKEKYQGAYPSMISFITGPSRTGDIERILVLGAHGPKKLTILCV